MGRMSLLFGLTFIALASCDGVQNKVNSISMQSASGDYTESRIDDVVGGKNKKTKAEIIEEKIGPGWEGLGPVQASNAVKIDGRLVMLTKNSLTIYLYAKSIGNDIIYLATTTRIEDWGDESLEQELVSKGDFSTYDNRGEEYHFNATSFGGTYYFNLP